MSLEAGLTLRDFETLQSIVHIDFFGVSIYLLACFTMASNVETFLFAIIGLLTEISHSRNK